MTHNSECDVAVIGGSAAGMQVALTLGRACRRVVVIDSGRPRNEAAARLNNYLGQDGARPSEFIESGRRQLGAVGVSVVRGVVEDVAVRDGSRPVVSVEGGLSWSVRAVVLATGMVDVLPEVPGVAHLWGTDVVVCPHCHGWEVRGESLATLGRADAPTRSVERAVLLSRWSEDVRLFKQGATLSREQQTILSAAGVRVIADPVRSVVRRPSGGVTVGLQSGTDAALARLFVVVAQRQPTDLARRLGCEPAVATDLSGPIWTDASGRSSVPNVWIAGTAAQPALLAIGAAGHGASVALAIHDELTRQEVADTAAVHGSRSTFRPA